LGADASEIVFTSCGTEADNTALRGGRSRIGERSSQDPGQLDRAPRRAEPGAALARDALAVGMIRAGSDGRIDLDDLSARLDAETALVSVLLANNETGVLQPAAEAARLAHATAPSSIATPFKPQAGCHWMSMRSAPTSWRSPRTSSTAPKAWVRCT